MLTPSIIIRYAIPITIQSFLTFLKNKIRFYYLRWGSIKTRSYISFSIIIDLIIINHIGQFAKPVNFLYWAYILLLDSFAIAGKKAKVKKRFLLIAFKIGVLLYNWFSWFDLQILTRFHNLLNKSIKMIYLSLLVTRIINPIRIAF